MWGGRGKGRDNGSAARNDRYATRDDRYATRDKGSAVPDDGSVARDDGSTACYDGYGSLKKIGRRRVQGWVTMGVARATTTEIARQRVAGRATTNPTPRGCIASTVYKGED